MALGKSSGPKAIYLQVSAKNGDMTRWVRDGENGGHEEKVDYVTGQVHSVDVREHKWQDESISYDLSVGLKDPASGERYYMVLGVESRMASRLVGQLNAMDLTKEHYFRPYLIKEGDKIGDEVASMTSALFSVKPILGAEGDKLNLGEGVKPFYGEQYGSTLPKAEAMVNKAGQPIVQNGKPLYDSSERKNLTAGLIGELQAKLAALKGNVQQHAQGDDDGIDAGEAAQATSRMRGN